MTRERKIGREEVGEGKREKESERGRKGGRERGEGGKEERARKREEEEVYTNLSTFQTQRQLTTHVEYIIT